MMLNIAEQKQEALGRIRRLPHAHHMSTARIEKWIDDTASLGDGSLLWHVDRLGGFGGSEMGGLVKSLRNEDDFYSTAHSVCAGKLCIVPPSSGDEHTERGKIGEPIARARFENFLTQRGLRFRSLDEIQRDVIEGQANPVHVWMRSSLDGLYEVEVAPGQKEVWLVDFKCPTKSMVDKYVKECETLESATGIGSTYGHMLPTIEVRQAAEQTSSLALANYNYQLHHYYEDARLKGVQIDRMMLSVLDFENGFTPVQIEVEPDQRVINEIIEAGEYYWHSHVQQGEVPDPIRKDIVTIEDMTRKEILLVQEMLTSKLAGNALLEHSKEREAEIKDLLSKRGKLDGSTLDFGAVQVKAKPEVDEERAIRRLQDLGYSEEAIEELRKPGIMNKSNLEKRDRAFSDIGKSLISNEVRRDPEQLRPALLALRELTQTGPKQEKGVLDAEMVTNALLSCKEDANLFVKEKLTISQTRKASIELDHYKDKAKELAKGLISQIQEPTPEHDNDQDNRPQLGQ